MPDFRERWAGILNDCGLEVTPDVKLALLAATAGNEEMRFLLGESERIEREWAEVRAGDWDGGDVSDDYWRMAAAASRVFSLLGPKAARFLMAELQEPGSSHRRTAARMLLAVPGHVDVGAVRSILSSEPDEEIRGFLGQVLNPSPSVPCAWWQFWKRGRHGK